MKIKKNTKLLKAKANKIDLLFEKFDMLSNDNEADRDKINTPMNCVKTMVDYLPKEFWRRKKITILDPCAGYGNFGAYLKLKTHEDNIYHNELDINRFNKCKQNLNNPKNISNDDAFNIFSSENKFDLIIANPPYSGSGNKNKSISNKFIESSIDSLNDDGYLCFITPSNWMSFNNNNTTLKKLLKNGCFINIDFDAKKFFKGVGSSFVIFIWQKTKKRFKTKIKNNFLLKDTKLVKIPSDISFLPLYISQEIISIIKKTIKPDRNKFNYRCDLHNFTKSAFLNDEKDGIFKYPTIHTARKTRYSTFKQDIFHKWTIIIPLSTYYIPYLVKNKNITQSVGYISFENKKEASNYLDNLNKNYIKVLVHLTRYGNFNCVKLLKHIDFDSKIHFDNLEIQEIELLLTKLIY